MFPELDKKALRYKKMNTNNQPVYFKTRIFMENYYIFSQLLIQAKLLGHFIEVKNTSRLWDGMKMTGTDSQFSAYLQGCEDICFWYKCRTLLSSGGVDH